MCGICGMIGFDEADDEAVESALRALHRRGPDASGARRLGSTPGFIGSTRLAIIDPSGGRQPMSNERGDVHVVFNGEIYNHASLRRRLEAAGHTFASRCDTEVLVHGYEEWGTELPALCDGEFAFAVLDERRVSEGELSLLLARDRHGVKPLHTAEGKGGAEGSLAFASEPKAIVPLLRKAGMDPRFDPSPLAWYLALGYIPSPRCAIDGIEVFPAASWRLYRWRRESPRGRWTREGGESGCYWTPPPVSGSATNEDELVRHLDVLLEEATTERLEADVPLGVFLSGGLDSSTVAWYASRARDELDTFSAGFREGYWNELPHAALMAGHLGSRHHTFVLEEKQALAVMDEAAAYLDEPFCDSSMLATWLLCKATRRHATVALSGDGGDEILAGYFHLRRYSLARYAASLPRFLRRAGRLVFGSLEAWTGGRMYRVHQLHELFADSLADPFRLHARLSMYASEEELSGLLPDYEAGTVSAWLTEQMRKEMDGAGGDPLDAIARFDARRTMQDDFLVKVDRCANANSLEVRVPMLDTELSTHLMSVPVSVKLGFPPKPKRLLRRAMEGRIPRELLERRKHGFVVPVDIWASGTLRDTIEQTARTSSLLRRFVDTTAMLEILDAHCKGERRRGELLFRLLLLERWLRHHEDLLP